uniref:KHDC4/BBP-like KH-domain type I domain-containing protein n=1 Tax=Anopheles atroparvus TaxID=41427 RepID=A0AAG5DTR5_ANOAO
MIRPHFDSSPIDYQQQHQQHQQHHQQHQQHQQQQQQHQHQQQQQRQISKIVSSPPPTIVSSPTGTTMCVAKLMIGLDHAPPAFNVRSRVLGEGGTNLNYIRTETGALVTLQGRGSMHLDPQTMQEAPEPLHLFIEHPALDGLQCAKQLAKNLIETLQEELSFFQENNVPKANFQLMPQTNIVQTSQVTQMPPLMRTQHVTQPNGIIHQPPPTVLPPQSFVQHPPALPQSQPPPPQIIQQPPTIIQSHVPVQIHQQPNNVVISQIQTAPPPQLANVSNPPPGTQIRPPIVQIKNPPSQAHLSQPPPSIQIQQTPTEAPQQIIVNPAPPFQLQYIQQNPSIQTNSGPHPNGQVTIQHLIQPQPQPVQGIVQTTLPPPQFDHFQRPPQTQQIITVQGSTAFMVPPPNIIHQTAPQPQNQIIFQTQQPILTHHPPPELTPMGQQPSLAQAPGMVSNGADDKKVGGPGELQIKPDSVKLDEGPPPGTILQQIPNTNQLAKTTVIPVSSMPGIPISQPPPPIMSVPPPTVQHIVGNTIITSQPNPSISHGGIPQQIYSQIPVSIQSFAPAPAQQMQVSGSHFVVSAPQPWPVVTASAAAPQIQQVPVSSVPSIQITTQPMRNPNEIHIISQPTIISATEYRSPAQQQQQIITTSAFNPQIQPPPGVQVQFHTVPPPTQQIITSLPNAQTQPPPQAPPQQMLESQPPHPAQPQHQIIINAPVPPQPPPPPPTFATVQYSPQDSQKSNVEQLQQRPPQQPQPQQQPSNHPSQLQSHIMRTGQKRKMSDDDVHKTMPPKIGMGMNGAGRHLLVGSNRGILTPAQAKCIMSSVSTGTVTTTSTSGGGLISSQISADHITDFRRRK